MQAWNVGFKRRLQGEFKSNGTPLRINQRFSVAATGFPVTTMHMRPYYSPSASMLYGIVHIIAGSNQVVKWVFWENMMGIKAKSYQ